MKIQTSIAAATLGLLMMAMPTVASAEASAGILGPCIRW